MIRIGKFIKGNIVTYSNMAQVIQHLEKEERVDQICKKHSLNFNILRNFFLLKMRGFNNTKVAQKLGVHRVTIQRYTNTLRKLKESEFNLLHASVFEEENGNK